MLHIIRLYEWSNEIYYMENIAFSSKIESLITQKRLTVASPSFVLKFTGQFCTDWYK